MIYGVSIEKIRANASQRKSPVNANILLFSADSLGIGEVIIPRPSRVRIRNFPLGVTMKGSSLLVTI
jgi:hypothetical protein